VRQASTTAQRSARSRALVAPLLALLLAAWACGGDPEPLEGLTKHRDPDFSFVYPEGWELTHDTFDLETPNSRVLILRTKGQSVVMLHRFAPPQGWTLEQFTREFSEQRERQLRKRGVARPRGMRRSSFVSRPRGRPLEGIRQDFELEENGVVSEQTSLFFAVPSEDADLFVSAHLPTAQVDDLEPDLRTVLSSLLRTGLARVEPAEAP